MTTEVDRVGGARSGQEQSATRIRSISLPKVQARHLAGLPRNVTCAGDAGAAKRTDIERVSGLRHRLDNLDTGRRPAPYYTVACGHDIPRGLERATAVPLTQTPQAAAKTAW